MEFNLGYEDALQELKQVELREASLRNGDEAWTVVYANWSEPGRNGGRFAAFSDPEYRQKALSRTEWDIPANGGGPGFLSDGNGEVTYFRNSANPRVEPLIIIQEFHNVVPDSILISEEFRLLMNLWKDPSDGNFYTITESGDKEIAIKFLEERVDVRTPILRKYQAMRQLDLLLFTDSVRLIRADEPVISFRGAEEKGCVKNSLNLTVLNIGESSRGSGQLFSRLLVKKILPPPPRKKWGLFLERAEERFPEFIIGEDECGKEVCFTCDERLIKEGLRINPNSPGYLTPVFFKPEVLRPYYDQPGVYSVSDTYLECGSLWGVQIDNNIQDAVMVFLGDIGRDIPSSHRDHWRAHNIPPMTSMSEGTFRRSFLNKLDVSRSSESLFKEAYLDLQEAWQKNWGWRIHREPGGSDWKIIQRLRIPLNETDAEFEAQLLGLAKLLIDLLNEKQIGEAISRVSGEKGISKLGRFLCANGYAEVEQDIALLKQIQNLRSRVVAHTSGDAGQALLKAQLGGRKKSEFILYIMQEVTLMLRRLASFEPGETDVNFDA
ncbi:hypothetical protein ACUH95_02095 [Dermabacteraceae bacterium P13101]